MNNYKLETTTIWSFPDRGNWATHRGDYRGNWSPHIPRNLILRYTKENELILDCFLGSGTTLIEAKLLNRNSIGVDINPNSLKIAKERLNFTSNSHAKQSIYQGDARNLYFINDDSIDFICTHPPYADIIHYSDNQFDDLSNMNVNSFLEELEKVSIELYRSLKKGKYCAFMIGDIRKNGVLTPLGFLSLNIFLKQKFILKEIIIKEQHNCKSSDFWVNKSKQLNFYLLAHEYIFVLLKA